MFRNIMKMWNVQLGARLVTSLLCESLRSITSCGHIESLQYLFRIEDRCKTCTQQSRCKIAVSLLRYTVIEAVLISECRPVPSLNS